MDRQGHAVTKPPDPARRPTAGASQSWVTWLTNLKIGISGQGFVDQPVTLRVPGAQVHDVTLGLLICQGHGWKLARSRRKQG